MAKSPAVIPFNTDGVGLAVSDGLAIPLGQSGFVSVGYDGTNLRFVRVNSSGQQVFVGAGVAGTPAGGVLSVQGVSGGQALPISVASLPLPSGAATEATLATLLTGSTFTARVPVLVVGGGTEAAALRVTIASDSTGVLSVDDNGGSLTVDTPQLPAALVGGRLDENIGAWMGSTAPTVGQKTMVDSIPVVMASNQSAIPVTFTPANARTGVSSALVVLGGATSGTLQVFRATAYNEPAAAAQRSLASSSANDAAAGTGARTVKIRYFDGAGDGPFEEVVTLNGVTPVNTVATDIRFIELMEVLTVGAVGSNVGTITLYGATGGGGGVVGSIGTGSYVAGVGDNRTIWAHHYTPTGWSVDLAVLVASIQSGGAGTTGKVFLRYTSPLVPNSAEVVVGGVLLLQALFERTYDFHIRIPGLVRVTAYGVPGVNNATMQASFDWSELPT